MKHLLSFSTVLLSLLATASPYSSGDLRFFHLNVSDGLSQNTVFSVSQGNDGQMWFATSDGINRYDGYNYFYYGKKDGVDFAPVTKLESHLFASPSGSLFAFCGATLLEYEKSSDSFKILDVPLSGGTINSLSMLTNSIMLIAADTGICAVDITNDSPFPLPDSLESLSVKHMASHRDKLYIVTCDGGLSELDRKTLSQRLISKKISTGYVNSICVKDESEIWLATEGDGILSVSISDGRINSLKPESNNVLPSAYVRDISSDNIGKIWIGTAEGLVIYDIDSDSFTQVKHNRFEPTSLSQNSIKDIFRDNSGGMWLATYYGGVEYCFLDNIGVFKSIDFGSENDDAIGAIAESSTGILWIGTSRNGVYRYDPSAGESIRILPFGNSSRMNDIKSIFVDESRKEVFIGTQFGGLAYYDELDHSVRHPDESEGPDTIYSMLQEGDDWLWIGASDGIWLYNRETHKFFDTNRNHLSSSFIYCLFRDKTGTIWAGAENCLYECSVTYNNGVPSIGITYKFDEINQVQSILERDGQIWVATKDGLYFSSDGIWSRYEIENSVCKAMHGMLLDRQQRIWVSTENGLFCIDTSKKSVARYYAEDGMKGDAFNMGAYYMSDNNIAYLGGVSGIVSFDPESISFTKSSCPPQVSSFLVNGERFPFKPGNIVSLKHNQRSLTLEPFTSNYSSWRKDIFRYRFLGADSKWQTVNRSRIINCTNLKAGSYTIEIQSINNDGVPSPTVYSQKIRIRQVWYKSLAFNIFILLSLFSSIILLAYRQIKNTKKFSDERQRKYQEEIEKLTIAHYVGKPLSTDDSAFILKALKLVKDNISDPSFCVESLAGQMFMSRANLHLKFKKIAGYSPVEFIQKIRMETAADLLENSNLSISQISEQLGFSSPSYFSTRFKTFTGKTPGQFR